MSTILDVYSEILTINKHVHTILLPMNILKLTPICIFAVCVPLLLISLNIRCLVSETWLYEYGFDKYDIEEVTGIDNKELVHAAKELIHYFNSGEESAQTEVVKNGQLIDLFSQREIDHLKDVKDIIRLFYLIQWIALSYIILYIAYGFINKKRAFFKTFARGMLFGSIFTLSLFSIVGIWALIDFDSLFLAFHELSFTNDLWILDPSKDYLIMMFPEDFFMDAAFFLVGGTLFEVLALGGGSWAYMHYKGISITNLFKRGLRI